ncbi:hypothetical protein FCV20_09850 [Clostridium botulinum]|uniref:Uncharacterized protein n=1 Tax=Clostridium botulinum (strain Langeland / NCTC 10281 / Type F) TaxID=441772 RepID=A7GGD2_CLOBL|nr:hypothetical protein CLI_2607 [Clostridium botulinum F str. Langeland]NFF57906.1 hypothetical protein [Clostridium botulinum]NEZ52255.1 hypothetical protein [Clostridium botulinum F str. Langeland]NFL12850.1 hypothetical protein [Clostridium botulinum]NFL16526.1 hypothetical protein [Clostridium botulinum]
MNFGPMMYYPQSMPTYMKYGNNYNDEELNGYRLARARRYRRHFHHHFFHPFIWPWWIWMNRQTYEYK